MSITTLLTRNDGSAGRVKRDRRPVPNLAEYIPAAEWNNVAQAVVDLMAAVGVGSCVIQQPEARTVSTNSVTLAVGDIGNVVQLSFAGAIAGVLPDLSAGVVTGRAMIILVVVTNASGALTLTPTGAGVKINGSTSAYAPTAGPGVYSFTSFDGKLWYR